MQAIEFWSTVCYCETSVLEDISDGVENAPIYLKLVEQAAPLLVPIMLETLTKQQVRTVQYVCHISFALYKNVQVNAICYRLFNYLNRYLDTNDDN